VRKLIDAGAGTEDTTRQIVSVFSCHFALSR
jgi:hypothetical protein